MLKTGLNGTLRLRWDGKASKFFTFSSEIECYISVLTFDN